MPRCGGRGMAQYSKITADEQERAEHKRGEHATSTLVKLFEQNARLPIDPFMQAIERYLDCQDGSLHPQDDVTLLGMEVA